MSEKDIYELIEKNFDDKIKLDFNDVKKRIEMLDNKSAVITSIAPSPAKRRNYFGIIAAAAACFMCIMGISVFFSQFSMPKSENAAYESVQFDAAEETLTADDYACYDSEYENSSVNFGLTDEIKESAPECSLETEETVSDSDISESDLTSVSDTE